MNDQPLPMNDDARKYPASFPALKPQDELNREFDLTFAVRGVTFMAIVAVGLVLWGVLA